MAKLSRILNDHIIFYFSDSMNKLTVNVTQTTPYCFGFAYSLLFPKVSCLESSDAESILDMRLEKEKRYAFTFKWFLTHR